jgi:glutaredoxin-dependent peroxiredoxin
MPNFAGLAGYTTAKRAIFILDKDGIVSYMWITDDPTVEPNYGEIENFLEKME